VAAILIIIYVYRIWGNLWIVTIRRAIADLYSISV
jgi:hypothetical protein